jgi:hypothetical protein
MASFTEELAYLLNKREATKNYPNLPLFKNASSTTRSCTRRSDDTEVDCSDIASVDQTEARWRSTRKRRAGS